MRQRGEQYREYSAQTAPHVLNYDAELVVDGRTLDRPVNCALARVIPPKAVAEAILRRRRPARRPRKPCVIGNCQAGWALMSLASLRPGTVRSDRHHTKRMSSRYPGERGEAGAKSSGVRNDRIRRRDFRTRHRRF
nr:DUF3141 domain-containing protein [Sinorhizobium meliloti]